ncbi:hypothetical protein, partial [Burkholderia ubonensis]|uniref:hypothetical protein n=1 Tax=Burkholderia ubonensis TaxID=101571 RepID=UPI000B254A5E
DARDSTRDEVALRAARSGRLNFACPTKYGYGKRALVEAQISRIKRCTGARLLTRRLESQQREGVIIANLVNLWNSFGKAVCVKSA